MRQKPMRFPNIFLLMTLPLLLLTQPVSGEMFRWKDKKGVSHYSNQKPPKSVKDPEKFEEHESDPAPARPPRRQMRQPPAARRPVPSPSPSAAERRTEFERRAKEESLRQRGSDIEDARRDVDSMKRIVEKYRERVYEGQKNIYEISRRPYTAAGYQARKRELEFARRNLEKEKENLRMYEKKLDEAEARLMQTVNR